MAAKRSKQSDDAGGGIVFGLLLLIGIVITLIWWILAAALLVGAGFAVRAIVRMHQRRLVAYAAYEAAMAARADEQLDWVLRGDDRGVYGAHRPALVEPPRPWTTARLAATIGGVVVAALVGAVLLVTRPPLLADEPARPAASPSSRAPAVAEPAKSTSAPSISYPVEFTGQDRQFADQALARGLIRPTAIAGLPGFAHAACNSLKSSVRIHTGIEDPALAWSDAKREELNGPYSWKSEPLLDLAVDNYCPGVRPAGADRLSDRSPQDLTFIDGWYELANRYRILSPATAVMMVRAHGVCEALMSAPEWEVVQDLDASDAGNNRDFKAGFVALAKESYCPMR